MFRQGYGCTALAGLLLGTALSGTAVAASKDTILYNFKDRPDGALPSGDLIPDGAGGFFGTTERGGRGSCPITQPKEAAGCGTVFQLTPPVKGKTTWTETTLYSFKGHADGALPVFGLLRMGSGILYGTTVNGGTGACAVTSFTPSGCGTIFKLTPPAKGRSAWTETVLYSFKAGADGAAPGGSLTAGPAGTLYGATIAGGSAVCKADPAAALLPGCGTVFKLTPPAAGKTAWTESVLFRFQSKDGSRPGHRLTPDRAGALSGATEYGGMNKCPDTTQPGCGTIFKLTPPAKGKSSWTETVLHDFKGGATDGDYPQTELTAISAGGVYGTTSAGGRGTCSQPNSRAAGCGTIFKLVPPMAGETVWTEEILYNFTNTTRDGSMPVRGVTPDPDGNLYGTTGSAGGPSIVFKLAPPVKGKTAWSESALYDFQALGTGHDGSSPVGGLIISGNDLVGTTLLGGSGCISCGTVFEVAK